MFYILQAEFEALVQSCGDTATFFYLKQISRVRVDYTKVVSASWAVQNLKGRLIHNCPLRVQRSGIVVGTDSHLKPPKPQKQFLISPPSSPPVDWEPPRENAPTIAPVNFELLAAVAGLSSEPFELHSSSAVDQPSIMVIAPQNEEDDKHESTDNDSLRHAIAGSKLHTSRPPIPK